MADQCPEAKSIGDHLHLALRMGISSIPLLGGAALEFFNSVIAPPLEMRRNEFMNDVAERLKILEFEERLKIDDLIGNAPFISVVIQATASAVRNHQKEKIDALRNTVLNSALGLSPDDAKRDVFLMLVDHFTALHLRVLREFSKYNGSSIRLRWAPADISSITDLACKDVDELKGQESLGESIVDDLCRKGMLNWNRNRGVTLIKDGSKALTEYGEAFIQFISEPSL